MKFGAIVEMQYHGETVGRPANLETPILEPSIFWQAGHRKSQTDCRCRRRIEAPNESQHHPSGDIERDRDPRPAHRFALKLIYDHDVDQRVIDLD
jgi:hypothetical protein